MKPSMAGRFAPVLALLAGAAVLLGQLAGCTAPSPLGPPDPPSGTGGACGPSPAVFDPLADGLTWVGTDTTLDLATWNLEFFPLELPGNYNCPHPVDAARQQMAANIINTLGLDVIAIQEISDPAGFAETVSLCPGYAGIVSPEVRGCNYQRPGIIYRRDIVTVQATQLLFPDNEYAFPRSPLQADLTITSASRSYDLHLIVVHLKASSSGSSLQRRRAASAALKEYLDQQMAADSTADYMIAGDWNDELDDPVVSLAFPGFLDDEDGYQFLDLPMAGLPGYASYPRSGGSLIDHILINRAACPDFAGGRVATLRLDLIFLGYRDLSDHRPVMVQAPVFR